MEAWVPTLLALTLLAASTVVVTAGLVAMRAISSSRGTRDAQDAVTRVFAERARAALDAVPDWVLLVQDDVVVDSNAPTRTHFQAAGVASVGQSIEEAFPDRNGLLRDHIQRAAASNGPVSFEFLHSNSTRYAETRVYPLGDGLSLVLTRDMTARKAREEVLHRSKERFALAVQGANDGLWDWDRSTDEVYYSYQWKNIVGYDTAEEANHLEHWFERVHPDDILALRAALDSHVGGEAARFESEHRIKGPNGAWLWVLARGMAVRDSRGVPVRVAGSITDLTNRRVVEVTQEKANLLEHATHSVGIGIAILDSNDNLVSSGDLLRRMTSEWRSIDEWWSDLSDGYPPPDPVPCPTCGSDHFVGTVLAEVYRPSANSFSPADPDLLSRVFEIVWAGHAHEIGAADSHVLLIKDVTDRVRAERRLFHANEELVVARDQALAASRAKSTFLANMSHELRTPLNHILGYTELVLEELEDLGQEDLAGDLGRVRDSGRHLLDLITGILDMSRIEAGMAGLTLDRFPATRVVDAVVAAWQVEANRRGNEIRVLGAAEVGEMLSAEEQVRRILDALVSNAVKFTENGTITVEVSEHYRNGNPWMVFQVADTGIGMAPERARDLFADFAMGDESSTRAQGGAGIGLTLCQRFADMLGGSIDVQSRPGQGSTFQVTLPREVHPDGDDEDEATVEHPFPQATSPSTRT